MINATSRKECLALLLKNEAHVKIVNYSQWHITAWVDDRSIILNTFLSIYSQPDSSMTWETWDLLNELILSNQTPWIVIGYFNEKFFHDEKVGER